MPLNTRINARSLVSRAAISLGLVAGCGSQEPSTLTPAGPVTPTPSTAPGPAPDLKGIQHDLENIKKDVTPPVIIKPDQPSAPAATPGKTG